MEKQGNKYVSNNKSQHSTTANSYIRVDMTKAVSPSTVIVNAEISSEAGCDIGYAVVTETSSAPSYTASVGRFIYISGTSTASDYTTTLQPGKIYYIHFGYRKDGSVNTGTDTFTINSINIEGGEELYRTNENGQIVLRLKAGNYVLTESTPPTDHILPDNPTTNITVSKQSGTQAITITNEKTKGTVIVHYYIEGTTTKVPLQNGGVAEDITKRDSVGTIYATRAAENVHENYELVVEPSNSSGTIVEGTTEVIYYYRLKPAKVIVHHYIKGTTNSLADDEELNGRVTQSYVTNPHYDFEKYELEKDENNQNIVPANQTGTYKLQDTVVTYYYVKKKGTLTVHHLIEGTTENIKLANGSEVLPVTTTEDVDTRYETSPMPDNRYKVSQIPTNANGDYIVGHIDVYYYYVLNEKPYTVEYYYGGIRDDSKTYSVDSIYGEVISDYIEKFIDGYRFDRTENLPLTVGNDDSANVIKVYYELRTDLDYIVYYKEQGTERVLLPNKQVRYQRFGDIVTENAISIPGYDKVAPTQANIEITTGRNEYTFYYTKAKYNYTVEYYYNNVKDDSKTDTFEATYMDKITTYTDKVLPGYKILTTANFPLTIGVNEENNVIKIYYVTDNSQTKTLNYTVEYYKDDERVNSDTQVNTKIVQVLEPNTLEVNKDEINTVDKYEGYVLDKTEPTEIPDVVTSGDIIKVYYIRRTDLSYKVNYLEEGTDEVLHESKEIDGQRFGDIITEEAIDITGYNKVEPIEAEIEITAGTNEYTFYYTKRTDLSYKVNYLELDTDEVLHEPKVVTGKTYKDKINSIDEIIDIVGFNYNSVDKDELEITTEENIINIYYTRGMFNYVVEYYYDGIRDDDATEILNAKYQDIINTIEHKEKTGYDFEKVEGMPLTISENVEQNIIKVYYVRGEFGYKVDYYYDGIKDPSKTDIFNATYGDIIENYENKASEDYTLDRTENLPLTISENTDNNIINIYYVRKAAEVIVKYVNKLNNEEIIQHEKIEGQVHDQYNAEELIKDIENYTYVESTDNTVGNMTLEPIEVIHYYLPNSNVIVNHIDRESDEILETERIDGKVGDVVNTNEKDFDGYVLVIEPEEKTVTMAEDEIILNYYYAKISAGVVEKHIDFVTDSILDSTVYEGNEGDSYKTDKKEFEGYDFIEELYPENSEGIMTVEPIEVKYYYIRQARVKVEYIDIKTGEIIPEYFENDEGELEEKDSTEIITGHENDHYTSTPKDFENYDIVEEMLPQNAEGIMKITTDDDGNIVIDTKVTYYYIHKAKVIEKHIDIKTNETIPEIVENEDNTKEVKDSTEIYNGHQDNPYKTKSKEFEGYDLIEEMLPENSEGTMTAEPIEVNYYYSRKATVKVEYIDIITEEKIPEKNPVNEEASLLKDSTVIIEGHEGDQYKTNPKEFDGYKLVEEKYPENSEGQMTVTKDEDGNIITEIVVKYYYIPESAGVIERHIDITSGEILEERKYKGYVNDDYKTSERNFEGYDIVREKYPQNYKGKMTSDIIEVDYYYTKKTSVIIQYIIDTDTNNSVKDTEEKTLITQNKNTVNSIKHTDVKTGDDIPVITCIIIFITLISNIVLTVFDRKSKKTYIK